MRSLSVVNVCLMLKWWWRYGREHKSLWKQVIYNRYSGFREMWIPAPVEDDRVSKVWKVIVSLALSNIGTVELFLQNFKIIIGNGEKIQFGRIGGSIISVLRMNSLDCSVCQLRRKAHCRFSIKIEVRTMIGTWYLEDHS